MESARAVERMMSEIKFKRVSGNDDLPLPSYTTAGAAGMDLRAFLPDGPMEFVKGQISLISIGFSVELPRGTEMQIRPRSGLALKHGFLIPNAPGTVDSDYRGVVMVGLYYVGDAPFVIRHGDRIAQAVIAQVQQYACVEVDALSDTTRGDGGFGSTGLK
ncbi:dUTP diphosphatase [Sulfitobacter sp. M39]|nr:dUTP diphosphatase [Sulfitobacter sp. M39]